MPANMTPHTPTKPNLEEALKRILDPGQLGLVTAENDATHVVIPEGHRLTKVPFDRAHPLRKKASLAFRSVEDFIAYVNEHKDVDTTRIFYTDGQDPYFNAVIDYHGTAGKEPNFHVHSARLDMKLSEQAALWFALDGVWIGQIAFAEFIADNASDVSTPPASEMVKIALELEGATSGSFSAVNDLHNGNMKIVCKAETTTTITVPREITLRFPIFGDSDPVYLTAQFRFRVENGAPRFCLRFPELAKMRRDAVKQAKGLILEKTSLPVWAAQVVTGP